jgi:outer membrane protein assembly factor BamB
MRNRTTLLWVLVISATVIAGIILWSRLSAERSEKEQAAAFPQKWEFTAAGPISAALALGDDGTLYAASEDGFLYALDSSGNLRWKFEAGPMAAAPIVGADGTIYVATKEERIYAINPSGTQQWAAGGGPYADKQTPWRGGAIDQNFLYTPWRGLIRAIRLTTGAFDRPAGMGFEQEGSVSILPNGLIVYPGVGRLDAADSVGRIVWQFPVMNPPLTVDILTKNGGHPPKGNFWLDSRMAVGTDGTFYAAAGGSTLVAITMDGTLKWEFKTKTLSTNRATPVIAADGTIYFAGGGTLFAVNPDGSQKWALEGVRLIAAAPVLTQDGTAYLLSDVALLAVSPEGKLLARVPFSMGGKSSPTLAPDGTFYVASQTGRITAFSTTHGPLMNSPWPKFQRDLANSGRSLPF